MFDKCPTESASSSSSYSSMSVLMLSSRTSLSSSSQPTKNLGAPRRLSPGLLGSDITVPRGSPQHPTTPSYTNTPPEQATDGRAQGLGKGTGPLCLGCTAEPVGEGEADKQDETERRGLKRRRLCPKRWCWSVLCNDVSTQVSHSSFSKFTSQMTGLGFLRVFSNLEAEAPII